MALSKIKEQHLQTTVAFGHSGLPLGQRDDIDDLAIIAHESGDKTLLHLFEKLPPLDDLKRQKVEGALKKIMPERITPVTANTTNEKSTSKESSSSSKNTGSKKADE